MPDETDIIISELSNAPQIDDSAVFPLTQDNGGSPATFKATMSQIAGKIGEGTTFANLHTTSKTLVGALNELKDGGSGGSAEIIGTASGSIATFADGGNGIPLKSCEVEIVATQSGTGTPSPSNPRAISGFDSVDVNVTGKNLFDDTQLLLIENATVSSGVYSFAKDKAVAVFGRDTAGFFPRKFAQNTVYTLSFDSYTERNSYSITIEYTDDTTNNISVSATSMTHYSLTSLANKTIRKIYFNYTSYGTTYIKNIQLEESSSETTYEPFGTTTSVSLGQTIYGGTAELVNGNGSDELLAVTYTGQASEDWGQSGEYFYTTLAASVRTSFTVLCSCYKGVAPTSYTNLNNFECAMSDTLANLNIRDNRGLSLADFKTWLSNNPMTIIYKRVTPQSFTFTGANIPTLSGTNNIYADSGDIQSLEYFNENADEIAELVKVFVG